MLAAKSVPPTRQGLIKGMVWRLRCNWTSWCCSPPTPSSPHSLVRPSDAGRVIGNPCSTESVNALVRDFLGRYVDARSRRLEALEQFEAVAGGSRSASQEPWSRESLHERI